MGGKFFIYPSERGTINCLSLLLHNLIRLIVAFSPCWTLFLRPLAMLKLRVSCDFLNSCRTSSRAARSTGPRTFADCSTKAVQICCLKCAKSNKIFFVFFFTSNTCSLGESVLTVIQFPLASAGVLQLPCGSPL